MTARGRSQNPGAQHRSLVEPTSNNLAKTCPAFLGANAGIPAVTRPHVCEWSTRKQTTVSSAQIRIGPRKGGSVFRNARGRLRSLVFSRGPRNDEGWWRSEMLGDLSHDRLPGFIEFPICMKSPSFGPVTACHSSAPQLVIPRHRSLGPRRYSRVGSVGALPRSSSNFFSTSSLMSRWSVLRLASGHRTS